MRTACNPAIVSCLGSCDPLSTTCTNSGVPVPPPAIEVAMWFITKVGYCCGGACSAAEYVSLERDLIASNASHAHSWLPAIRRAAAEQRAREESGLVGGSGNEAEQRVETQQEAEDRVRLALASTEVPPLSTSCVSCPVTFKDRQTLFLSSLQCFLICPLCCRALSFHALSLPCASCLSSLSLVPAEFLVTKSEFTDKACAPGSSLFSFQYEPATCKLVNATIGGGPITLMYSRIACTDDDAAPVPVTVYYAASDAACAATPLGVATATFPAGCHENSAISCMPRQADFLFRSSVWFNSAQCEASPAGFYYAAKALASTPCFVTPSGSVAATCAANGTALATVSMFHDSACQVGQEKRIELR